MIGVQKITCIFQFITIINKCNFNTSGSNIHRISLTGTYLYSDTIIKSYNFACG